VKAKVIAVIGFIVARPVNMLVVTGIPSHQPTSARAPTDIAVQEIPRVRR
jgi:hypothetical protein